MPSFEVQADGSAVIRHDDGTPEAVAPADVAARYAALSVGRGQEIDEQRVLEALRAHMSGGGAQTSETSQLPESLTHTSTPSE